VERRRVFSGSPWEPTIGYCRALVDGRHVFVSGTCAVMPDGTETPPDAYGQAARCFEIIRDALAKVGAKPEHVVRTRVFLSNADDYPEIGRAHAEFVGDARPASSMVLISGFIDPSFLVEIEADALLPEE
jgi:enamine deaminase RidA (YjgF/YER057c/UK114 family)